MSSDICDKCTEYSYDCRCNGILPPMIQNYFLTDHEMTQEVKVWVQMFFNDGSVTQGKYIARSVYDHTEEIIEIAKELLRETCRKEGVLFIWGAGQTYARKVELFLARRGAFKGRETLRLRRL